MFCYTTKLSLRHWCAKLYATRPATTLRHNLASTSLHLCLSCLPHVNDDIGPSTSERSLCCVACAGSAPNALLCTESSLTRQLLVLKSDQGKPPLTLPAAFANFKPSWGSIATTVHTSCSPIFQPFLCETQARGSFFITRSPSARVLSSSAQGLGRLDRVTIACSSRTLR